MSERVCGRQLQSQSWSSPAFRCSDPSVAPSSHTASTAPSRPDPELEQRVRRACERISENLHICANEPSLAFYRLAEHVRKSLPPTVDSRGDVRRLQAQLHGAYFDAEYGLAAVQSMSAANASLANAQDLLKNAIFLQQQIKIEQQKRGRREPTTVYQRLSAHIQSVDIPDFSDLKETARETANRVESAFSRGSTSSISSLGAGAQQHQQQQPQHPTAAVVFSRASSVAAPSALDAEQPSAKSQVAIARSKSVTQTDTQKT